MSKVKVSFNTSRRSRRGGSVSSHKLPKCENTGLARYRDRHQARDAAEAFGRHNPYKKQATFACPDCHGFHLEALTRPLQPVSPTIPTPAVGEPSRHILVDIENLTGGRSTREEARKLWRILSAELDFTANDRVVVGGNRHTARKLSTAITGPNVGWVVGAMGADGADRALLAAVNLFQIAKSHDELVIMSGDHAFANLASLASKHGVPVHVVGQRGNLSRRLQAAATRVTHLPMTTDPASPESAVA